LSRRLVGKAISGGYGPVSASYTRAYSDGRPHLPGIATNRPWLYQGVLLGYGIGGKLGGMLTFSFARLIDKWSIKY